MDAGQNDGVSCKAKDAEIERLRAENATFRNAQRACEHCDPAGHAAAVAAERERCAKLPLTDDEVLKMWRLSNFRGSGGQADWFAEGIRAAERAHGIGA